ncbi:MAG: Ig-like domain-containing protein [Lachnospiraceae bacterium]|nr:Ig-like domain-containing protein [Lachnospiraceae bacterium]
MGKKKPFFMSAIFSLAIIVAGLSLPGKVTVLAASKNEAAINITDIVMKKGQSRTLKLSGTKKKVTWKSSKKSVVKVNSKGKMTAKKRGTATVTGTVKQNKKQSAKKYTCKVRVSAAGKKDKKVLVAYFSQTGTTKAVASKIHKLTGGDILRIREKDTYPKDYDKTVARAKRELNKNARPKITSVVANMKDYDIIYIGYPIWWHSTPKVVDTFLAKYNLKGKTVIPFCTSGGSDISESMDEIKKFCKGSTILEGYTADSGSTKEIRNWLIRIGMLGDNKIDDTSSVKPSQGPTLSPSPTTPSTPQPPEESQSPEPSIQPSPVVPPSIPPENTDSGKKKLIVYFSWSSNTEKMATYIQEQTGGDLLRLQPVNPYPEDYGECGNVAREERDNNARPEIANLPVSLSEYDTILVGYPIWWHTAPMIIGTFLENYDLSGMDIYPFTQSASMDIEQFGNSMNFIRENALGATVHDGLFVRATDTTGIYNYLEGNRLIK